MMRRPYAGLLEPSAACRGSSASPAFRPAAESRQRPADLTVRLSVGTCPAGSAEALCESAQAAAASPAAAANEHPPGKHDDVHLEPEQAIGAGDEACTTHQGGTEARGAGPARRAQDHGPDRRVAADGAQRLP